MNHAAEPLVSLRLEDRLTVKPGVRSIVDVVFKASIKIEVEDV